MVCEKRDVCKGVIKREWCWESHANLVWCTGQDSDARLRVERGTAHTPPGEGQGTRVEVKAAGVHRGEGGEALPHLGGVELRRGLVAHKQAIANGCIEGVEERDWERELRLGGGARCWLCWRGDVEAEPVEATRDNVQALINQVFAFAICCCCWAHEFVLVIRARGEALAQPVFVVCAWLSLVLGAVTDCACDTGAVCKVRLCGADDGARCWCWCWGQG